MSFDHAVRSSHFRDYGATRSEDRPCIIGVAPAPGHLSLKLNFFFYLLILLRDLLLFYIAMDFFFKKIHCYGVGTKRLISTEHG